MTTDYAKIDAINWSSLKHMATSPLLYKWRVDNPEPPKQAYLIGSAIHCATLEPDEFSKRYGVYDGKVRRGKAWDEWKDDNPRLDAILAAEKEIALASADAVHAHPIAGPLLTGGCAEEFLLWNDPDTGVAAKGRLDFLRPTALVDLKSARSINARKFSNAAAEYLYHGQLAWYHDGAVAAHRIPYDAEPPYVISVEKAGPYDVAVDQLSINDLDAGRTLYRSLLAKLLACIEADYWPGQAPELRQLDIPAWAPGMNEHDEESVF